MKGAYEMRTGISAWMSVVIASSFCTTLSANVEDMFVGIQSPPPENGLVFEIAVPKQTYFFFEPVTVFVRFRNVSNNPIALIFEQDALRGIASKMSWKFSSLDGRSHSPSTYGSTIENVLLIPAQGAIYVALPDKMFFVGRSEIRIEYKHSQSGSQPPLADAKVWEGAITSNALVIIVERKDALTTEEQERVTEKIRRHISIFRSDDPTTSYLAEQQLIPLAKYSVPILLRCLTDEDGRIRSHAIETLGAIANTEVAQKNGIERDTSFLDALIAAYSRERETEIKATVVNEMANFYDAPPEMLARIVPTLRKAVEHPNKNLRAAGARVLLGISPGDGIQEVVDRISDGEYFGTQQGSILGALKQASGQDFGTDANKWRSWWLENRKKFKGN